MHAAHFRNSFLRTCFARQLSTQLVCVMQVLTTSNITEAIDLAFVDRADIKAYIGNPGLQARLPMCTVGVFLSNRAAKGSACFIQALLSMILLHIAATYMTNGSLAL